MLGLGSHTAIQLMSRMGPTQPQSSPLQHGFQLDPWRCQASHHRELIFKQGDLSQNMSKHKMKRNLKTQTTHTKDKQENPKD